MSLASHKLDPTKIKNLIIAEEEKRCETDPKVQNLNLQDGQQCVRDFFVALTLNQAAWPDVFRLFDFQIVEQTECPYSDCRNTSSSTQVPQLYIEIGVPPSESDLATYVE